MSEQFTTINVWADRQQSCEKQHGPLPVHGMYLAFTEWPVRFLPGGVMIGDLKEARAKTRGFDAEQHAWLKRTCPDAQVEYLTCKRYADDTRPYPDFVAVRVIFPNDGQRESFFEAFPDYRPQVFA